MADVVFLGVGASGFPSGDVQIFQGVVSGAEADVTFDGPNEFSVGQGLVPTEVDTEPEITDPAVVELIPSGAPILPASTNPNDNAIAFYVVSATATSITVNAVSSEGAGVPADLTLYNGVHAPSGLCGKFLEFVAPTTMSSQATTPMQGTRREITNHTANVLNFVDAIPTGAAGPTLTDRIFVLSTNRALRRTPVLEIILG